MPSLISSIQKSVARILAGPDINIPRKGAISPVSIKQDRQFMDGGRIEPRNIIARNNLQSLAERDDVIVALRRVLRNGIGNLKWHIVPDIDAIEADIKRWKSTVALNLAMPGMHMTFHPQAMTHEFYAGATGELRDLLVSEAETGAEFETSTRLHQFFENILAAHSVIAESHVAEVKSLFDKPNANDTWRSFISRVVDQLSLFDAAAIVKNPMMNEDRIGEIYLLPGEDVRVYRRRDLLQPIPPFTAFDWSVNDRIFAYFNAFEMCYITANPQQNGYGKPPLEALVQQMLGSISGDQYLLEFFANNNMPAGIFDLGPNVDQGERDAVETHVNNQARKGLRRIMFVSNMDGVKGFMPMPQQPMKDNDIVNMFDMWTKRKAAVFGLSPNDIGHTQDMHLANADNQAELTQSRGIDSIAKAIENELNVHIVKGTMWRRNNPEDVNDPTGIPMPVFPFQDVRFEFITGEKDENADLSDRDLKLWGMGALSTNEIRKSHGLPPVPGGDTHVVNQQVTMKVDDLPNLPAPTQMDTEVRLPDGRERDERPGANAQQNEQRPPTPSPEQAEKNLTALAHKLAQIVKG